MDNRLVQLASQYRSQYKGEASLKEGLHQLYNQYVKKRQQVLLEAAAAAGAVHALFFADRIDTSQITPQMEEAFRLAFPNLEIESLIDYSPDQLRGVVSAWKGKYFEVLIRDKLNQGEWVGDLHLEPGQVAVLADSPSQAGWDLQILNPEGSVVQELQAKATDSLRYVKEALERYPDIQVITTDDLLQSGGELVDSLFPSGISDSAITKQIISPMESLFDTNWENLCENILPFLPFIVITTTEGTAVLLGKKSAEQALSCAMERVLKSSISIGVGSIVALLDGGVLSLPSSVLTRILIDRYQILCRTADHIDRRILELKALPSRSVL
jgi:hypothetical protein